MSSLNVCFVLLSQRRGLHMWPTALGGLDHVGSVTTYIAEIRPAACEDRTLIEQGKGGGRLPQKKIVSDSSGRKNHSTYVMRWVIPLRAYRTSIGFPWSSNAGETSKAARINATPSHVEDSAIYCPGHLLKGEKHSVPLFSTHSVFWPTVSQTQIRQLRWGPSPGHDLQLPGSDLG